MCASNRSSSREESSMGEVLEMMFPDGVQSLHMGGISSGLFGRVMDKCAAGLALLGLDGEIREANRAFRELAGHAGSAIDPDCAMDNLLPLEDVTSYRQHIAALSKGEEESYRQTQRFVRPNGLVVWVDLTVNLLRDTNDAPALLVVTAVDITEQRRTESTFRDMSMRDPLTKLPNRRLFRDKLQAAVSRAERDESHVGLLFLDLDEFKPVNDNLGHDTGDWLLKAVAQRLEACLRSYDTAARLGGDEFVVLLPDLGHREYVFRVAERIRSALCMPFVTDEGRRLEISVSIGVSLYPEHAESAHDLLNASDEAMYTAKKAGRNRIVYSDRTPTPTAVPRMVKDAGSGLVHLTWEPSFGSGNAFIDTEHRELFRQANQLLDLATRTDVHPHAVHSSLVHLVRSVDAHFKHEERILKQVGYSGLADHAIRHHQLMSRAQELCERSKDQALVVGDILDFVIAKVIYGHVVTEDREYFGSLGASESS
jgi:diguanylate cyclase (GGDEF)-like protein/hemerythrin-like metal-binding protein/PAS domain S-box-containing protein